MCVPKNLLKILIFEKDLPPLILVFRKILYDSLFEKYIFGKSSLDSKIRLPIVVARDENVYI